MGQGAGTAGTAAAHPRRRRFCAESATLLRLLRELPSSSQLLSSVPSAVARSCSHGGALRLKTAWSGPLSSLQQHSQSPACQQSRCCIALTAHASTIRLRETQQHGRCPLR